MNKGFFIPEIYFSSMAGTLTSGGLAVKVRIFLVARKIERELLAQDWL